MSTKESLLNEFSKFKGQIILYEGSVYRYLGVSEDQWDYYRIIFNGRDICFGSVLSKIHILKDKIDDYADLVRSRNLNDLDKVAPGIFEKEMLPELMKRFSRDIEVNGRSSGDKLLTELCFDIN